MSDPKHTPGPWAIDRVAYGDEFDVTANDGAILVAQPPTEADALLIAAAPELLAEHANAIGFLEGYAEVLTQDGFTRHAEKIDALIARMKATQARTTGTGETLP